MLVSHGGAFQKLEEAKLYSRPQDGGVSKQDPLDFIEKVTTGPLCKTIQMDLDPSRTGRWSCMNVDEKSQIQALDPYYQVQAVAPRVPVARWMRRTHDYVRHGTQPSLFDQASWTPGPAR